MRAKNTMPMLATLEGLVSDCRRHGGFGTGRWAGFCPEHAAAVTYALDVVASLAVERFEKEAADAARSAQSHV